MTVLMEEDGFTVELVLLSTVLRTGVVPVFNAEEVVTVVASCAVDVSVFGVVVLP